MKNVKMTNCTLLNIVNNPMAAVHNEVVAAASGNYLVAFSLSEKEFHFSLNCLSHLILCSGMQHALLNKPEKWQLRIWF